MHYALSTSSSGAGSIGTAARPINTSAPASNSELLAAGSGGIYFVDWGSPLSLSGATATGAGSVEVVAANAGGHNLTVTGNVSTGSGNIVLAADDNFTINSGVTVGGSGFSGDVYLASNRDTGNTTTLTDSGTLLTSNTSASAVVVEGFHMAGNGTAAGVTTVNNITVGNGGTITVSTVPFTLPTGQGSIAASSSASVLNAGPNGTVTFIATTMAGNSSNTTAVGTATTPITVTAGTVNITANTGTFTSATAFADSVYVTDTIAGNFTATTGATSPSGSINLTTTNGVLTVNGAINTGNNGAINLTGAGGVTISGPLGSMSSGAIAVNAGANNALFTGAETFYSNDPVTVTAGTPAEITSTANVNLSFGTLASASGVQVDNGGSLVGTGTVNTGTNQITADGTLAPTLTVTGLSTNSLTLNSDATLKVTLNCTSAGQFSEVFVTGAVTLTNPTLVINVGGAINVGNTFEIISNDLTDAVTGAFANATFTASNLLGYTFTVNYAGGDGNDVVLTVTAVPLNDTFDVTSGTGTLAAPARRVNNHLTVGRLGGAPTPSTIRPSRSS